MTGRARPSAVLLATLLAILLGALLAAAPAGAARLPGPSAEYTGFTDDLLFEQYGTADVPWMNRARSLGASWIRMTAYWSGIQYQRMSRQAATNPASTGYYWAYIDESVRAAAAAHQHVLMQLYSAPQWEQGPHRPSGAVDWKPNVGDYAAFAHAVATRYSGRYPDPMLKGRKLPKVTAFQIWNEPNHPNSLSPQWTRVGRRWVAASPGIYRQLLNAGYAAVKAVQPHAYVVAAGLAPYGDRPGGSRVKPITFAEDLLCLNGKLRRQRCRNPAHFDALDIHPYGLNPLIAARVPGDVSVPDVHELTHVLAVARRDRTVLPRGRKPVWATELDWGTNPPDPSQGSLGRQSRYLDYALYELWRQGVDHVLWFEMRDPGSSYVHLFPGAGLYFHNGQPKPSTQAFHFPFVAVPATPRSGLTIWGRAPSRGRVTIERASGHAWRRVMSLRTTAGGVFYGHARLRPGVILRAVEGSQASVSWRAVTRASAV